MIQIKNLTVFRDRAVVLSDISFSLDSGSSTFLLGQNGSGKSSLALTLAGHPSCTVMSGDMLMNDESLLSMPPEQRARKGIFISFQHPVEMPGVSFSTFLAESHRAIYGVSFSPKEMLERLQPLFELVGLPFSYAQRPLNVGFSGGEKKRSELIQLLFLLPHVVILDEIDSGLDAEGVRAVQQALSYWRTYRPDGILMIISHYPYLFASVPQAAVYRIDKGRLITL